MNSFRNAFASAASKFGGGKGPSVPNGMGSAITSIAFLGIGGYTMYHSFVTVQPGHQGVIYSRLSGLSDTSNLNEGLNVVIPWLQRAIVYDMRARPQLINTQSGSKDLQMVQISLRVLFRPDPMKLSELYRRLGKDYDERVLPSIVNEVTKAVVAQYNASELLTKRETVSLQVQNALKARAREFSIVLDDVSITHLAFSKEYSAAIEAKQVAQQDSERAKYVVERAIQEKKTIVIRAAGEAKSAELIGSAIQNNPAFIQLRRIDASREVANTIASSSNKVYLDADTLLLNTLGDVSDEQTRQESAPKKAGFW